MIIVDLDNCISDDKWRHNLIHHSAATDFLKYHAYHMAIPGDELANAAVLQGVDPNDLVISTSRPVMYRWLTTQWLDYHKIQYAALYMREKEDAGLGSVEVKRKALHRIQRWRPLDTIRKAYDDRPDVIAMYKAEGIVAEHLFIHPYDWKEWYGERSGDSGRDGSDVSRTERPLQG